VLDLSLNRTREILSAFMNGEEPDDWQEVLELDNSDLWLTIDEVRDMARAYSQLIERYRGRRQGDRPAGSRRVRITRLVVPRPLGPAR
jgi:hypothetical protein